jgi:rubrerythrin
LEKAIEGETYEYTQMYPQFESIAMAEGNLEAAREAQEQTAELDAISEKIREHETSAEGYILSILPVATE